MKTTLKIKLCPSREQHIALKNTMMCFNEACNYISEVVYQEKCYSKFKIQAIVYKGIREKFNLTAQMAIRAIGKVIDAYRRDRARLISFKPLGAVIYDERIMSFKKLQAVSLWTIGGRQLIPMILGGYQTSRMRHVKGQADLVLIDNVFYLLATVETPEPPTEKPLDYLGVDMGIVNLATDSTGEVFTGQKTEQVRQRYFKLRQSLQEIGTKSAKRHLKKIRRKESKFRADVNHRISKKLVEKAKDTHFAIVLEDLKGIRNRTTVGKSQRAKHAGWAFYQLMQFIIYKAKRDGVLIIVINPKDTSRECFVCWHIEKANRKSQAVFQCKKCGHTENADFNAAKVIARRAAVNQPIVSSKAA